MAVNREQPRLSARQYVDGLAAAGRYFFTSRDAQTALGVSAAAAKLALLRLAKQQRLASPARGFYVIVPPEYRSIGCLPAEQFIPALMKHRAVPYYAALLSAAQYHGAAHQRPQTFQVCLPKPRRPLVCGKVRVTFIARTRLADVPVHTVNTPRGTLRISTPEATALDLVGYPQHSGGLAQVATVLAELAERIDADTLAAAAQTAPLPWAQRLGYLLERVGARDQAAVLKAYVRRHATQSTVLVPKAARARATRDDAWKLYVNVDVPVEP